MRTRVARLLAVPIVDADRRPQARGARATAVAALACVAMLTRAAPVTAVVVAAAVAASGSAQTLDLDGVPDGPSIPAKNAAHELARGLEAESAALEAQAAGLRGEARGAVLARVRIRQLAQFLLDNGASRPWSDSASVVYGLRLANLTSRADALIEKASKGQRADGTSMPAVDARAAVEAVAALSRLSLDSVRTATSGEKVDPGRVASALARTMGPLATVIRLVEGARLEDCWPSDARQLNQTSTNRRAEASPAAGDVAAEIAGLPEGGARSAAEEALAVARGDGIPDARLLRAVGAGVQAIAWVGETRAARRPWPLSDAALDAVESRAGASLEALATSLRTEATADAEATRSACARLEALAATLRAVHAMIAMRRQDWTGDRDRDLLAEACASLAGTEAADDMAERARLRVALRIEEACLATERILEDERANPPRDLRDVTRILDRNARTAIRTLPAAFAALAADPLRAADPEQLSALARVTTIVSDRERITALQSLIDRIGGIRPKAARDFKTIAKRLAVMLGEPLKRDEAQAAFTAIESQAAAALPFPFEEELKRRDPRAMRLTGGEAERVLMLAAELRLAWADELAAGRINGPAAVRLDLVARYCAMLRDAAPLGESITRADGDRLAMWGAWGARRALLAPATVDIEGRTLLATRSLLASDSDDGLATLRRDVEALERSLPVVRLAATLERSMASRLRGDPNSLAAFLAPAVQEPTVDAAFVREHEKLLMLTRALLEAEQARRVGDGQRARELGDYLARLATDIEASAFGASASVGRAIEIESGGQAKGSTERRRRER
jgi:hypothetical protein